jgi:hypothetical protein
MYDIVEGEEDKEANWMSWLDKRRRKFPTKGQRVLTGLRTAVYACDTPRAGIVAHPRSCTCSEEHDCAPHLDKGHACRRLKKGAVSESLQRRMSANVNT